MRLGFLVGAICVLSGGASVAGDVIERRGSDPKLEGRIEQIDDNGVTLKTPTDATHVVPWDRIRNVSCDHPNPDLEKFRELSTNLWRARTRLERHDALLAEPLFERLFERYRGQTHETALIVAEGLLRCRLARFAHDMAVIPALETARIRRQGIDSLSYDHLTPVIDDSTSLCMALAPAWAPSGALARLERELDAYDAKSDTVIAGLAALYRRAVLQQLGSSVNQDEKQLASDQPGVALLQSMVRLSDPDATRRQQAVDSMMRTTATLPEWAQAWGHFLVGASLLSESGAGRQQQGLVSMASLPARFALSQPYLAGLALAHLWRWCDASGDHAAALSLRAELQARYPNHPAIEMSGNAPTSAPAASRPDGDSHKDPS